MLMTTRRHRGEQGAASLETTGMTMAAAVVVLSVLIAVTPQARIVGEAFSYAICQVVTFGQGGCASPSSSAEAHEPTEPCVLSNNGIERNTKVAVLVFTASDGRRIQVENLSNGEYRVTVTDTGGAGAEVGVGGGLSLTVADTTVGGTASASAGGSLDLSSGDVYYADADGIDNLMSALQQDQIKDAAVGDSGPFRWGTDRLSDLTGIGDNDLPAPDETYAEGGVSLNASAEATGGAESAKAGVSAAALLGVRNNRDGSTTLYLKSEIEGEAGMQSLGFETDGPEFQGAGLSGSAEVVSAVTFDGEGNMTNLQVTSAVSGSSSGLATALFNGSGGVALSNSDSNTSIFQSTLEINDSSDQSVVNQYLLAQGVGALGGWTNPAALAQGIGATQNFFEAAQDRGVTTRQDYDTDSSTPFALDASGKVVVELGVSGNVKTDSMNITGAEYWDGTQWVDWEACQA